MRNPPVTHPSSTTVRPPPHLQCSGHCSLSLLGPPSPSPLRAFTLPWPSLLVLHVWIYMSPSPKKAVSCSPSLTRVRHPQRRLSQLLSFPSTDPHVCVSMYIQGSLVYYPTTASSLTAASVPSKVSVKWMNEQVETEMRLKVNTGQKFKAKESDLLGLAV